MPQRHAKATSILRTTIVVAFESMNSRVSKMAWNGE